VATRATQNQFDLPSPPPEIAVAPSVQNNPPAPPAPLAPVAPPGPPNVTAADFDRNIDPRKLSQYYPARALEREREGTSQIRCQVTADGRLANCVILSEDPKGWGFGEAHIRAAREQIRVRPRLEGGQPTEGGVVTLTKIRWALGN